MSFSSYVKEQWAPAQVVVLQDGPRMFVTGLGRQLLQTALLRLPAICNLAGLPAVDMQHYSPLMQLYFSKGPAIMAMDLRSRDPLCQSVKLYFPLEWLSPKVDLTDYRVQKKWAKEILAFRTTVARKAVELLIDAQDLVDPQKTEESLKTLITDGVYTQYRRLFNSIRHYYGAVGSDQYLCAELLDIRPHGVNAAAYYWSPKYGPAITVLPTEMLTWKAERIAQWVKARHVRREKRLAKNTRIEAYASSIGTRILFTVGLRNITCQPVWTSTQSSPPYNRDYLRQEIGRSAHCKDCYTTWFGTDSHPNSVAEPLWSMSSTKAILTAWERTLPHMPEHLRSKAEIPRNASAVFLPEWSHPKFPRKEQ